MPRYEAECLSRRARDNLINKASEYLLSFRQRVSITPSSMPSRCDPFLKKLFCSFSKPNILQGRPRPLTIAINFELAYSTVPPHTYHSHSTHPTSHAMFLRSARRLANYFRSICASDSIGYT